MTSRFLRMAALLIVALMLLTKTGYTAIQSSVGTPGTRVDEVPVTLDASIYRTTFLSAAQPLIQNTIMVDGAEQVRIIFASTLKTLSITLIDPAGQRHHFGEADTPTIATRISPDPALPTSTGANYFFLLTNPPAGLWQYEIQNTQPLTSNHAVILHYFSNSTVRSGLLGGGEDYRVDRPIRLAIMTLESAQILNTTTISATLHKKDDAAFAPILLNFVDDGTEADQQASDGLYTASVLPGVTGEFYVAATVEGTNAHGKPFLRTLFGELTVQPVRANLPGTFTDRAVDSDGDNRFDEVIIAPDIEVQEPGQYNITVDLRVSNGQQLAANLTTTLAAGLVAPDIHFSTREIKQVLGVDGPYTVAEVLLELLDVPVMADAVYQVGETAAYQLDQFALDTLELKAATATGVDSNGNQQFEVLNINFVVAINVTQADFYNWTARLVDNHGTEIALAEGDGLLNPGEQSIMLQFDGNAIGRNGVDGPYHVRNFIFFSDARTSLSVNDALTTDPYPASQFEGYIAPTNTPTATATHTPTPTNTVTATPTATLMPTPTPNPDGQSAFEQYLPVVVR